MRKKGKRNSRSTARNPICSRRNWREDDNSQQALDGMDNWKAADIRVPNLIERVWYLFGHFNMLAAANIIDQKSCNRY